MVLKNNFNHLMNLTQSRHNTSKTCVCNDCIYKSKGEALKDNINGSRIDKLYYDKYLPLRERKLIDKLVRTRGVYDDIRDRILSLSSVDITKEQGFDETESLETKSDSETNSAVQKLVDLVDRGEYPPLQSSVHLHSDCCGCCSCSSKTRIQKPYKVHMHIPSPEHIDRYVESHHLKMRKEVRQVGFNATRSAPCMCTLKFSKSPKQRKVSKASKKSANKKKVTCDCPYVVKPTVSKKSTVMLKYAENKVRESIRSTVTKLENVFHIKKDSLMIFRDKLKKEQDMKAWECDPDFCIPNECNPDECYEKVKRREAKKALQKATHQAKVRKMSTKNAESQEPPTGYELKRCFCTQQLQKPQKNKPKKKQKVNKITTTPKSKTKVICKCEEKEGASTQTKKEQAKKEILAIESVPVIERKAHDLLPYECEPHFCVPGKCNPIVCEERIKQRYQKSKIISKDTNTLEMPRKMKRKRTPQPKPLHTPIAEKSKSSPNAPRKQAVRISSSFRFDIEFFKEKNFPDSIENSNTTRKYRDKSVSSDIEEYGEPTKNKLSEVKINHDKEQTNIISTTLPVKHQNKVSQDHFLKRCLCTLKLHKTPKQKTKPKPKRPKSKMTMTSKKKNEKPEQVICKCEDIHIDCVCEPDQISIKSQASMPIAVVLKPKTLSKEINTEPKKSIKTITSKSATSVKKAKEVQVPKIKRALTKEEVKTEFVLPYADKSKSAPSAPHKQAVKISSSFRFDIEFYKDNTDPNDDRALQQELSSIPKDSKETKNDNEIESQTNKKVKKKGIIKCLCKLKLKKKQKQKIKKRISKKTMTTNSKTAKINVCGCKSMATQTKKANVKPPLTQIPGLLPYECEPNFCIPGKCDPLICEERIKIRNKKEEDKEVSGLKRCLCTLKFHHDTAKRNRTVIPLKTNLEVTSVKSMATDTKKIKKIKKGKHKLLPYECEPGVCTPGQCDPYECLKLIKKRNTIETTQQTKNANTKKLVVEPKVVETTQQTKQASTKKLSIIEATQQAKPARTKKRRIFEPTHQTKYANTENPKIKSVFSVAKDVKKDQKSQVIKVNTQTEDDSVKKIVVQRDTNPVSLETSRQSVKFGSECSFDIEFRKNKLQNETTGKGEKRLSKIKPKIGMKFIKEKSTKETHSQKKSELASELLANEDKSLIKVDKCFCTLKLHKKGHQRANNQTGKTHKRLKPLDQQQIFFVSEIVSAEFWKQTIVSPRECTPCLCIADQLSKLSF